MSRLVKDSMHWRTQENSFGTSQDRFRRDMLSSMNWFKPWPANPSDRYFGLNHQHLSPVWFMCTWKEQLGCSSIVLMLFIALFPFVFWRDRPALPGKFLRIEALYYPHISTYRVHCSNQLAGCLLLFLKQRDLLIDSFLWGASSKCLPSLWEVLADEYPRQNMCSAQHMRRFKQIAAWSYGIDCVAKLRRETCSKHFRLLSLAISSRSSMI
jgi:hypothetical protein